MTNGSYQLTSIEAGDIADYTLSLSKEYAAVDDPNLLFDLPYLAAQLPIGVQRFLRDFAIGDQRGHCLVRGHDIDQRRLGPTPAHWRGRAHPGPEFPEEILILLYAALLGEPFGWTTQQDGHLVHDIFPIRQHENDQLGMGSKELLTWHTEDAFHPYRSDYLILAALRNPDHVPTTVGELDVAALPAQDREILFEPRFFIAPDESHLPKNNAAATQGRFEAIQRIIDQRAGVAVLFGAQDDPYLRMDPYFMEVPDGDPDATRAYQAAVELIDGNMCEVVAEQGDVLFVNNHRAVHGRLPFTARYDGTDRWLKRICVTTDLRKSRDMRAGATCRLIG